MPRPPILPVIDWKHVFTSGKTWETWLDSAESTQNAARMRERYQSLPLPDECGPTIAGISRPVHVLAIAEDWCGDVIRHSPVLARIVDNSPHLEVRYISRNDNPDLFARFLTNGGEAIPKFIFLNHAFVECGNWGPMQTDCRQWVARGKAVGNVAAGRAKVREIYEGDPACRAAFEELCAMAELAGASTVE